MARRVHQQHRWRRRWLCSLFGWCMLVLTWQTSSCPGAARAWASTQSSERQKENPPIEPTKEEPVSFSSQVGASLRAEWPNIARQCDTIVSKSITDRYFCWGEELPFESKLLPAVLLLLRIYLPQITVTVTILKFG